jgi:pimeloyl-ACP methyl ester carboxylesterase
MKITSLVRTKRARTAVALTGVVAAAAATSVAITGTAVGDTARAAKKPTIVLEHGAFADSSSWNGVIERLQKDGYPVIAAANPLRGPQNDAAALRGVLDHVQGPVVVVGHSYGGSVISNAVNGNKNVKALVFVAGFAPDAGETAVELSGKFPGSTLGGTLAAPVALPGGAKDLYIQQAKYRAQFAADVPEAEAKVMASTQRPVTDAALNEKSGQPAWKTVKSWFIYGERDQNIPAAALGFMAKRAGSQETVVVHGASHALTVSQPRAVAGIIERAAQAN